MVYKYTPTGVCSQLITIDVDEESETINGIQFLGGCNGNLKGISALSKGKTLDEVISSLKGIQCGMKGTSCPDQLARALQQIKDEI
ncbi:MAG: TIGR03905 family TSCPD domain-containing protein [Eubacteriales bacterium]|nr:TIGR03905 family TSCPD domain-containing protein [Eubacteriales bacterium]